MKQNKVENSYDNNQLSFQEIPKQFARNHSHSFRYQQKQFPGSNRTAQVFFASKKFKGRINQINNYQMNNNAREMSFEFLKQKVSSSMKHYNIKQIGNRYENGRVKFFYRKDTTDKARPNLISQLSIRKQTLRTKTQDCFSSRKQSLNYTVPNKKKINLWRQSKSLLQQKPTHHCCIAKPQINSQRFSMTQVQIELKDKDATHNIQSEIRQKMNMKKFIPKTKKSKDSKKSYIQRKNRKQKIVNSIIIQNQSIQGWETKNFNRDFEDQHIE